MKPLFFLLRRYSDNGDSTQGILHEKAFPKSIFFSHVIEDEYRAVKVAGETRVPAGLYELKIMAVDTPLTTKHRAAYNKPGDEWFKFHIEVAGIPNFTGVYVHAGNDDDDTDGCLCPNDTAGNNTLSKQEAMARSMPAVKRFYQKVYPHLSGGGLAYLEIRDEEQ